MKVERFQFGVIVIEGKKYRRDILFFPDGKVEKRKGGIWLFGSHSIKAEEVQRLCDSHPELLLVGTGTGNRAKLSPDAERRVKEAGVKLEILPSFEAIDRLNELASQGTKVAGIIHITC